MHYKYVGHSICHIISKVHVKGNKDKLTPHALLPPMGSLHILSGQCSLNMLDTAAATTFLRSQVMGPKRHAHAHLPIMVGHLSKWANVASALWPQQVPHDFFQDFQVISKFKFIAQSTNIAGAEWHVHAHLPFPHGSSTCPKWAL